MRLALPEIPDEKALLASRTLAALGAALALAAAALDYTVESLSRPALSAGMILVALAAFVLGARPLERAARPRTKRQLAMSIVDARFRRNVRLSAYTLGMYAVFLLLAILGLGSILAAIGVFGSFTPAAVIGLGDRHLEVLLAVAIAALAGATPFAATIPVTEPLPDQRRNGTVIAAGVMLVGIVVAALAGYNVVPAIAGIAALLAAAVALFIVVHWNARLPDVSHVLEWLETDERVRKSDLPKAVVVGFSAVATASLLGAILGGFGLLPAGVGDGLLAVAGLAIVLAAFGVGITPVAAFEYGAREIEEARKRRVFILRTLSYGLAGVAGLVILLALLTLVGELAKIAAFQGIASLFVGSHETVLALLLLPLVGVLVTRIFVKSDRRYTDEARAAASLLAAGAVMLLSMGFLMGARIVTGVWVSETSAALFFGAAVVALTFFVRTRTLLPGLLEMLQEETKKAETAKADEELKETIQRRMLWTYVLSGLFVVGFIGFIAATSLGAMPTGGGTGPTRDALFLIWIIAGIAMLVVVALRYFQGVRIDARVATSEDDIGKRRLSGEEFKRYLILGTSAAFAVLFIVLGMLTFAGKMGSIGPISLTPRHGTDFFVFAILVGLGPYGFYHDRELKRVQAIDQKFPEFLRDLAESQRSGMTLTEAVITASKGTYGALTWDIRKMAAQIEWGISFEEALTRFAKRVRTPLIERTVSLITQASNAGGNVVDVLTAAADDSREIQLILKERTAAMSIYIMIIYIAFMVFIGVIAILNAQFIPEVSKAVRGAEGVSIGGLTFKAFDEGEFKMLFFHAAIVQGFGGGLVAGVMQSGKPVAGLKHAFVMVVIAYVLFRFVIGG